MINLISFNDIEECFVKSKTLNLVSHNLSLITTIDNISYLIRKSEYRGDFEYSIHCIEKNKLVTLFHSDADWDLYLKESLLTFKKNKVFLNTGYLHKQRYYSNVYGIELADLFSLNSIKITDLIGSHKSTTGNYTFLNSIGFADEYFYKDISGLIRIYADYIHLVYDYNANLITDWYPYVTSTGSVRQLVQMIGHVARKHYGGRLSIYGGVSRFDPRLNLRNSDNKVTLSNLKNFINISEYKKVNNSSNPSLEMCKWIRLTGTKKFKEDICKILNYYRPYLIPGFDRPSFEDWELDLYSWEFPFEECFDQNQVEYLKSLSDSTKKVDEFIKYLDLLYE